MRGIALLLLAAIAACSDPGPRDRSLLRKGDTIPLHPDVFQSRRSPQHAPHSEAPSYEGLKVDELAPLYPKDALLVVRCADLSTLYRHAVRRLASFAVLLPDWGLPGLPVGTLLRVHCQLPDDVLLDRLHPFAFVETQEGWVVLVPINEEFPDEERLRRIDSRYCVAGSPEAVLAYVPGGRPGHYMAGDFSVLARGDAVVDLGHRLTEAAAALRITLPRLADLQGESLAGASRVDLSLRFLKSGVRAELRVVPDHERSEALATMIEALNARAGHALGWLPADGSVTIASAYDVPSWLTLAERFGSPLLDPGSAERNAILREAIATLGDDAAISWRMEPEEPSAFVLVAELTEPDRLMASAYLASEKMTDLLREIGGSGNTLEYRPAEFERRSIPVGTVGGSPSPDVLDGLRAGRILGAPLARLFAHEDRIHIALYGRRLCITMGEDARPAMEALIDRIAGGPESRTAPTAQSNGLRPTPLLEATIDAAAFLRAARPGAPAGSRERLPAEVAVTTEGGALRVTMQLPLESIIAAWNEPPPKPAAPPERD